MNKLQSGAAREWLARMAGRLRAATRYAAARREFERLDLATLRDLAMGSSEFASYWAEASGRAERTRRRIGIDWVGRG